MFHKFTFILHCICESVPALLLKAELACVMQLWFDVGRKWRAAPMTASSKEISHSQFICAEDVGFEDAGMDQIYVMCKTCFSVVSKQSNGINLWNLKFKSNLFTCQLGFITLVHWSVKIFIGQKNITLSVMSQNNSYLFYVLGNLLILFFYYIFNVLLLGCTVEQSVLLLACRVWVWIPVSSLSAWSFQVLPLHVRVLSGYSHYFFFALDRWYTFCV